MDTLRGGGGGRDEWRPPSEVRNNVPDSTVEYLVMAGHIHGDLVVNLPPPREPADSAAEELARAVRAQWSAEVAAWELGDTEAPLAVRRLARRRASAAHDTGPRPVRGDRLGDVADALPGLDVRRLLVLGGPGSGKSTLLAMTVVLLAGRHLGDVTAAARPRHHARGCRRGLRPLLRRPLAGLRNVRRRGGSPRGSRP
ncbi:hypothetical protein [Streptomyces sp. 2A115]|uniref:hypothetical protein n=1 Tax=Streptomyces sp. 2A115 TaxID=3457439 RepID=UPI003FD6541D